MINERGFSIFAAHNSKNIYSNVLTFLFAHMIFISMYPFWIWGLDSLMLLAFAVFCFAAIPRLFSNNVDLKLLFFCLFFSFFFFLIMIPFREHDVWSGKYLFIVFSLFVAVFSMKAEEFIKAWEILRLIFSFVVVISLVSLLLYSVNFPFPSIQLGEGFTSNANEKYFLYYGMVLLSNQVLSFGPFNILRNCGWFAEPGHFGIYLCMLLLFEKNIFRGRINVLILIGIISTFSTASILFLLVVSVMKGRNLGFLWFVVFLFVLYQFAGDAVDVVLNKIFYAENILADRATFSLNVDYDNLGSIFWGEGRLYLNNIGYTSSNYDAFIIRYGIAGLLVFIFVIFSFFILSFKRQVLNSLLVLFFLIYVFMHRSWMVESLYFWFPSLVLMSMAVAKIRYKS